ncbi:MAG TPA: 2Fe-2S iron-sulfur cluster binding domain-containing protein [Cycloclasticus sp.]|jgi:toluene monooxygenase electron transfer component|nr:2Fe-2S iron-sulfur cluster binding domain-containing protein [Cycloclasticus sp.]
MASFNIKISEQEFEFKCEEGDTFLRAALRAGLGLPYECNSGGCGSCKVEILDGEINDVWPDAPGLSPRDIKKGRKLSCQCIPTSDCEIKVRLNHEAMPLHRPIKSKATLFKINKLTDDMAEFCFKTEHAAHFEPGQFALLDFPGVVGSRGYSMSNLPNDAGEWHFIIKKMPGGSATGKLFDEYKVGDEIVLDGPYGLAYLKPEIPRDIVCVGGGSGLSPEMSIIKAAAKDPRLEDRNIYLFYGGRAPKDICPPALIEADDDMRGRIKNFNAVSDVDAAKAAGWDGEVGFIHELLAKTLGDKLPEHEFYFCGPPPMTDALTRMLMMEYKVPFDQIHYDRFY